jgi:autophagy-related protein 5
MTTDDDSSGDDSSISKQQKTAVSAPASITIIQNANWQGRIPIQLSIAPTSLSSPNKPRPIHRMVSRMTYLHLGLFDDIMQLYEYAPTAGHGREHMMVVREEPPDSPPKQEQQHNHENDTVNKSSKNQETNEQEEEEVTFQSYHTEESSAHNDSDNNNDQRIEQPSSSSTTTTTTTTTTASLFPECWFQDEESGLPLRWQLFVGVLYDLMKGRLIVNHPGSPCNQYRNLPWKIRIHFTSYPTDQLLPLDITVPQQKQQQQTSQFSENESFSATNNSNNASQQAQINTLIGRMYRNSLKQALFLQYGSSKVAMSITKNNHEKMWDAVLQSNYDTYHQVNSDLQVGVMATPINNKLSLTDDLTNNDHKNNKNLPQLVPVRILLNENPAIQKPTLPQKKNISEYLKQRPTEILQDDAVMYVSPYTALGDVLVSCLPHLFKVDAHDAAVAAIDCRTESTSRITYDANTYFSIQGVQPSLSEVIVDLWKSLCHPDHFLYVVVVTQ